MDGAGYQSILSDFAAAVAAQDEDAARAASAPEAWHFGGETPRELFRQSQGKRGFTLTAVGEVAAVGDKAWGVCEVRAHAKEGSDKPPRSLGRVRVMMTPDGVVGIANDPVVVNAWMDSMITASARMASLPVSDAGQDWAEQVRAAVVTGGDINAAMSDASETGAMAAMMLKEFLGQPDAIIATLPSRWVPAAGRVAAGFLVTTPSDDLGTEMWATLQTTADGGLMVLGTSSYVAVPLLLQGAKPVNHGSQAPAAPAAARDPERHDDAFAYAVASARGELQAPRAESPRDEAGRDIVRPAPLLEQPEAVEALRESIATALTGMHDGGGPTNLGDLKQQAGQLIRAAITNVTRAAKVPSEATPLKTPPGQGES